MDTLVNTPKIYVACLASYNAGKLYGKWIDANQSAEAVLEEIKEMLKQRKCRRSTQTNVNM